MYGWLSKRLPGKLALLITALWYALLVVLVYALSIGPDGDFRYLQI